MNQSETLFERAQRVIPGGVNSPVRAFKGVGGTPRFIQRAKGAVIWDADGASYIDYVGSWGPMILGHADDTVIEAVRNQAVNGLSYGAPTELECELAELVCELVPSMQQVRMVSSGTEATMTAIRLARGATGRDAFIKFEGNYHGHADTLLVKAGSGMLTLGVPTSPGVPADFAKHTLTATFNDLDSVEALFKAKPDGIAAIIVEPIAGNMNFIPPVEGFLEGLRALCDQYGALLIFDEVMTGFRVALGGAQAIYGVTPDLTTLGKVIGGGMPVGALGGRRDVMQHLAPVGPVYQAGTLSGNPLAMAAGLATLKQVAQPGFYDELGATTRGLIDGLVAAARAADVPMTAACAGGMFGVFFSDLDRVTSFEQVTACDMERFKAFFHGMLDRGFYLAPSAYEAGFVSAAHTPADIDATIAAAADVFSTFSN